MKRPSRDCASVRVSSLSSIISIGVLVQPFRPSWMAAERAAFSSSVALGIPNAAETTLNASVSRSITSSRRVLSSLPFFSTSAACSAYSAYFLRPWVRPPTIAVSAAPMEP